MTKILSANKTLSLIFVGFIAICAGVLGCARPLHDNNLYSGGGMPDSRAYGISTDPAGNIYVTGHTDGDLDGMTNTGYTDLFIIKYNPNGDKQWTRLLGSIDGDYAYGITSDVSGNVYAAGMTYGGIDGNPIPLNYTTDAFVVKYDSNGAKQWTKQFGTDDNDGVNNIKSDSGGNIYAVGYTQGNFDGITAAGGADIFMVKYDSGGVKQWSRQWGTNKDDWAYNLTIDSGGNIYTVGETYGWLDGMTYTGKGDAFITKFDSAGAKQWTRILGTGERDLVSGAVTDAAGDIYLAGVTCGSMGGITNAGGADIFVVKYNSNGDQQWFKQLGTTGNDNANSITTDINGDIYIAGKTAGSLNGVTNTGNTDLFIVKYNPAGIIQWTKLYGTSKYESATEITGDTGGNIVLSGYITERSDDYYYYNNVKTSDLILTMKYDSAGVNLWMRQCAATRSAVNIYYSNYGYGAGVYFVTGSSGDKPNKDKDRGYPGPLQK